MIVARKVDCCVGEGLRRAERRWRAARLHQSQVWDAAGTRGAHTTAPVTVNTTRKCNRIPAPSATSSPPWT
eukprot:scaffold25274_cov53-Phaeocystis_antarctica.AAC.2